MWFSKIEFKDEIKWGMYFNSTVFNDVQKINSESLI